MSKKNILTVRFKKENNSLVLYSETDKQAYRNFAKSLEEGQIIEVFFDAVTDSATLGQFAKAHVILKELAICTGYTVSELKENIKDKLGLYEIKQVGEKEVIHYKSLSKCSKDELSLVIEELNQIAEFNGFTLK